MHAVQLCGIAGAVLLCLWGGDLSLKMKCPETVRQAANPKPCVALGTSAVGTQVGTAGRAAGSPAAPRQAEQRGARSLSLAREPGRARSAALGSFGKQLSADFLHCFLFYF